MTCSRVWLMPDNHLPGILEDFVAQLIPPEDPLFPKAEAILDEIESAQLNRYSLVQHPKALIHTWLAWEETPGRVHLNFEENQELNAFCQLSIVNC